MTLYIKGMGNISPQKTWGEESLFTPVGYNSDRLTCIEPEYSQWIDPRQLRRMSRVIKMGVAAGSMALKDAGITVPQGIITGTGYGCLDDTGIFLTKLVENREQALNPTPFIQSTHNTIGSQIALLLQCQDYNQTYAHDAFSFESALLDAMLQLNETPDRKILIGGVDEITDASHAIQKRFGIFDKSENSLQLFDRPSDGTLNGEGSVFFVLSGEKSEGDKAGVEALTTFYKPAEATLIKGIEDFLKASSIKSEDIDLILLGKNGDLKSDEKMDSILSSLFSSNTIGYFKQLCGEYPTASAFALWLGARIIQEQIIPDGMVSKKVSKPLKNILIYNQYFGTHHSLILLRACH
ncbi:MAG: beta-ketoacyl synthase N-terminal-like domain-containing protein [Chryseolinea sp.]